MALFCETLNRATNNNNININNNNNDHFIEVSMIDLAEQNGFTN